jgi:hypothetical protein
MCKLKYLWALLLLLPVSAVAGSATLTCTAPTLNEDGTPLTDLTSYRLYYSLTSGGPYTQENGEFPITSCGFMFDRPAGGEYFFVATAVNSSGVESAYSGEATKVIAADGTVPQPPGNLVVQPGQLLAYTYAQSLDAMSVYPVGAVPEGTLCDETTSFNGLYRVDVSEVMFVPDAQATIAFAACGSGT